MRDALIGQIYERMRTDENIFFLSADMGAPVLDKLREDFSDRFINVGIAEQNLINVSAGLALEGFTVYAYAIAPFLSMRAYEQIRINLALLSEHRRVNVNFMGVGAGISYEVSGPTHHCLEDLSIIRTLPNVVLFSPSDYRMAQAFVDYSIEVKKPKYVRLDGKPVAPLYAIDTVFDWEKGYIELCRGEDICIVSSGYMTQRARDIVNEISSGDVQTGLIDVFLLKPLDEVSLAEVLRNYCRVITLEDGFKGCGGLDSLIMGIVNDFDLELAVKRMGFHDSYLFQFGDREHLYKICGFGKEEIQAVIDGVLAR